MVNWIINRLINTENLLVAALHWTKRREKKGKEGIEQTAYDWLRLCDAFKRHMFLHIERAGRMTVTRPQTSGICYLKHLSTFLAIQRRTSAYICWSTHLYTKMCCMICTIGRFQRHSKESKNVCTAVGTCWTSFVFIKWMCVRKEKEGPKCSLMWVFSRSQENTCHCQHQFYEVFGGKSRIKAKRLTPHFDCWKTTFWGGSKQTGRMTAMLNHCNHEGHRKTSQAPHAIIWSLLQFSFSATLQF